MSQVGKLYKFYFGKIWQKNWLRIIIFTILVGVVWWFVIPWAGQKALKGFISSKSTDEQRARIEEELRFKRFSSLFFGGEGRDQLRAKNREELEDYEKKLEEGDEKVKNLPWGKMFEIQLKYLVDNGTFGFLPTPYSSNNAFFFQQTDGYTEGKAFWKMLFDISWWNLSGVIILYWFIFEVFDKTFFSPRRDGEEATVLTMTPGVKRSDLIWGKILAFLTFYFLINIVLFLIPFSIYYFWLAPDVSFPWLALLALITTIVGPLLFFGLIFAPYLFFGSLTEQKWIFSTLISFFPLIWFGTKAISSASWPYKVERTFFDPIWFSIISLVCGIFFLVLYYLRYQEEDLN